MIKARFTRQVPHPDPPRPSLLRKREAGIWQRRYWEHWVRDDRDFAAHVDYIHFNPVKHGLVSHPAAWPYSSFHRAAARGLYPADWAMPSDLPMTGGEP